MCRAFETDVIYTLFAPHSRHVEITLAISWFSIELPSQREKESEREREWVSERDKAALVLLCNVALRLDAFSPDKVKQAKVQNVLQGLSMKRHLKRFWQRIKYFNLCCWVRSCLGRQALLATRLYCFSLTLVTLETYRVTSSHKTTVWLQKTWYTL